MAPFCPHTRKRGWVNTHAMPSQKSTYLPRDGVAVSLLAHGVYLLGSHLLENLETLPSEAPTVQHSPHDIAKTLKRHQTSPQTTPFLHQTATSRPPLFFSAHNPCELPLTRRPFLVPLQWQTPSASLLSMPPSAANAKGTIPAPPRRASVESASVKSIETDDQE